MSKMYLHHDTASKATVETVLVRRQIKAIHSFKGRLRFKLCHEYADIQINSINIISAQGERALPYKYRFYYKNGFITILAPFDDYINGTLEMYITGLRMLRTGKN